MQFWTVKAKFCPANSGIVSATIVLKSCHAITALTKIGVANSFISTTDDQCKSSDSLSFCSFEGLLPFLLSVGHWSIHLYESKSPGREHSTVSKASRILTDDYALSFQYLLVDYWEKTALRRFGNWYTLASVVSFEGFAVSLHRSYFLFNRRFQWYLKVDFGAGVSGLLP